MNQTLLQMVSKVADMKNPKIKALIQTLHDLTQEEDGTVKGKLIMNVQPSMDENENIEILKLPEQITNTHEQLKHEKEQQKNNISNLKQRINDVMEKRKKMLEKIEKAKSRLVQGDRTDIIGMKKKLEKLKI